MDISIRKSEQHNIKPDVIFGTDIKLQAIDPYLFYLYEFRKYALASEIIIAIGYSFNDNHINDLIRQAMDYDKTKKIICVAPNENEGSEIERIGERLKLNNDAQRIKIENSGAKCFLENTLSVEYIGNQLPQTELPF